MKESIKKVAKILIEKKLTIAFAESATAGRLAAEFSMPKNAGKYLKGGLVCYDAALKKNILGVKSKVIEKHTPESKQVTKAITTGLQKLIDADIHVGITGLPAPGGSETTKKPVGTMFIHAIKNGKTFFNERKVFSGKPEEIIIGAVNHTAQLLLKNLQ
ncbi:CinA family protein [Pedobacter boryungensis]|uniref:Nicotinamide-nucleotide amidohydrolase family protein n=1 Tax=Pedobacter boryungensis TaxID=869962 RepID=A0ABX2DBV6_9SPHI|nr:nicotinamide-nucleotide amidohydrolase family protein [Pedobacter boryungensis]NQX30649.1 nicotinamide-nucleotide amidohydrolase family protein [Pedobacter boryungensis]